MPVVSIEGNIGSGKSTLLDSLSSEFVVIKERIDQWPLAEFYQDQARWAFPLQIRILQTMKKPTILDVVFHERCPSTSNKVFWTHLMENHLSGIENIIYQDVYNKYHWDPDYHIYLKSTPEFCFENIKKRNQTGDDGVTMEYLKELHELYEKHMMTIPGLVTIDAMRDPKLVHLDVINFIRNT